MITAVADVERSVSQPHALVCAMARHEDLRAKMVQLRDQIASAIRARGGADDAVVARRITVLTAQRDALAGGFDQPAVAEALRQLALMFDAGAPAEKILGQLGWLVRTKFPALAPADVRPAIDALFRTDQDLKRSAGDPRILIERLIVELCAGKRVARRW